MTQDDMKLGPMPTPSMRYADQSVINACRDAQDVVEVWHHMARPRRTIRDRKGQPGWATMMSCSTGEVTKRFNYRWADAATQFVDASLDGHSAAIVQGIARQIGAVVVPQSIADSYQLPVSHGMTEADVRGAKTYARRHSDKQAVA